MAALSTVLTNVRHTLQDEDSDAYRTATPTLVEFANGFVRELALLRPDLFAKIGDITCVADTCVQSAPTPALVLMDVYQVKGGRAVTEGRKADLDRFNPNWWNDTAAAAENWMRNEKNPTSFFIYPKAPSGQVLVGQWAELPSAMVDENSQIPTQVPESYYTAMHHYVVFRAEAKDDEAVLSNRARLFYEGFTTLVGAGKMTKAEAERKEGTQDAGQQVAQ